MLIGNIGAVYRSSASECASRASIPAIDGVYTGARAICRGIHPHPTASRSARSGQAIPSKGWPPRPPGRRPELLDAVTYLASFT